MQIMLFGGSFDPPHIGHQQIVNSVIKQELAEQVWYVPCYGHPFNKILSDSKHRLKMLNLIQNHKTTIVDYEIIKLGTSYSVDTLNYFSQSRPKDQFSWLFGSDQLINFDKWKNYQQILSKYKVYIYPRKDYPFKPLLKGMMPLTKVKEIDISSQQIRALIKSKKTIHGLVEPAIEEYIHKHQLYK